MKEKYIYIGCFVSKVELNKLSGDVRTHRLEKEVWDSHVTVEFRPQVVYKGLFGKEVKVIITGYGFDDNNEGFRVSLESDNPIIQKQIEAIRVPHITLSVSKNGKPVNTAGLVFYDIEPVEIVGLYGGYRSDGRIITSPM